MAHTTLYPLIRETLIYLEFGGQQQLQQFELTLAQYDTLRQLAQSRGVRIGKLGQRLLLDNSKMTRIVDALTARGLVERRQDPEDRRAWLVRLTQEGEALRAEAAEAHEAHLQHQFAALSLEEQAQLGVLLERIRQRATGEVD